LRCSATICGSTRVKTNRTEALLKHQGIVFRVGKDGRSDCHRAVETGRVVAMHVDISSPKVFRSEYTGWPDPWDIGKSSYEASRNCSTLKALAGQRYTRALEVGCSSGALTQSLSARCDFVEASDASTAWAQEARERCRAFKNVRIQNARLPQAMPTGVFDLIILSEVGFDFNPIELSDLGSILVKRLVPGGILLAVHRLGQAENHQMSGDAIHELLNGIPGLARLMSFRHAAPKDQSFRIERWIRSKNPAPSYAH
jgi:protein-L-isoaspartate O-methyltransferase